MNLRASGFGFLPPVVKNLLIINGLFFVATYVFKQSMGLDLDQILQLQPWTVSDDSGAMLFKPWQLITSNFMHTGFFHLLISLFMLWMFGSIIEQKLGSKRFLILYLISGIGSTLIELGVYGLEYYYFDNAPTYWSSGGASGAINGIILVFGYLFADDFIHLYFFIPIKAKYVVFGFLIYGFVVGIISFFQSQGGVVSLSSASHFAHIGGALTALILLLIWRIRYNSGHSI